MPHIFLLRQSASWHSAKMRTPPWGGGRGAALPADGGGGSPLMEISESSPGDRAPAPATVLGRCQGTPLHFLPFISAHAHTCAHAHPRGVSPHPNLLGKTPVNRSVSEEDADGNTGKDTQGTGLLPEERGQREGRGPASKQGWGSCFHSRAVHNYHLRNQPAVHGQTCNTLTPMPWQGQTQRFPGS